MSADVTELPKHAPPDAGGPPASTQGMFREFGAFVWRSARYLGVPERDLEDVCQEVFLVVHRRLHTFQGRSVPRTWLYGICLRVASTYRRRAHRKHEQLVAQLPEQEHASNPQQSFERNEARRLVQAALDQLDEDKRTVFVLYELEQLQMHEVAELVDCPLKTAYSRLYAARKSMTRLLCDHDTGESP